MPSRRIASCTTELRMSHSSGGRTSVRFPCWTVTIPSIASACTVSRATVRLTLYRFTISSEEAKDSPAPIRPDTISAARSVESWRLRRWGSCRPSPDRRPSVDTTTDRRELQGGEMPFEQVTRHIAERSGRRPQRRALEHAASHEHVFRAGVVVVDRVLHLEDEHRQDLAKPFLGEGALSPGICLVHLDEKVDQVPSGDDPRGAAAHAVEQVDAAVAAPDRALVAEPDESSR